MDKPQVMMAFLVLKMTLQPISAKVSPNLNKCPSCDEGYFMQKNCTITRLVKVGIQCAKCTDCSELDRGTLVACTKTSDSVCGPKTTTSLPQTTTPTAAASKAADSDPDQWIILTMIVGSVVLVILLVLLLALRSCRFPHRNKHQRNKVFHIIDPLQLKPSLVVYLAVSITGLDLI